MSTGAAHSCNRMATHLNVAPVGSPYSENVVAYLEVDNFVVKSDFGDHQGNINVLRLPPGEYEIYPSWMVAYPIKVTYERFSVHSGDTIYLGEYFLDVACTESPHAIFRDQSNRDLSLVKQRNPAFANVAFETRIPISGGDVPRSKRFCIGLAQCLLSHTLGVGGADNRKTTDSP